MPSNLSLSLVVCLLTLVTCTAFGSTLHAVEFAGLTPLYEVDQTTSALSIRGSNRTDGVGDLTSDPVNGILWGIRIVPNQLIAFHPGTGAVAATTNLNSTDDITSIAFDPVTGILYGNTSVGFGAAADRLYRIDPTTGVTTQVGTIGFNNVYALGFSQTGRLFGISNDNLSLISIDTGSGAGTLIGATGLSLAFDLASRPEDDAMFVSDSLTNSLYTINTATGATTSVGASLIGPLGSSTNVAGLAFLLDTDGPGTSTPEPGTFALIGAGLFAVLAVRRRRAT